MLEKSLAELDSPLISIARTHSQYSHVVLQELNRMPLLSLPFSTSKHFTKACLHHGSSDILQKNGPPLYNYDRLLGIFLPLSIGTQPQKIKCQQSKQLVNDKIAIAL